jgi:hypothetical protein
MQRIYSTDLFNGFIQRIYSTDFLCYILVSSLSHCLQMPAVLRSHDNRGVSRTSVPFTPEQIEASVIYSSASRNIEKLDTLRLRREAELVATQVHGTECLCRLEEQATVLQPNGTGGYRMYDPRAKVDKLEYGFETQGAMMAAHNAHTVNMRVVWDDLCNADTNRDYIDAHAVYERFIEYLTAIRLIVHIVISTGTKDGICPGTYQVEETLDRDKKFDAWYEESSVCVRAFMVDVRRFMQLKQWLGDLHVSIQRNLNTLKSADTLLKTSLTEAQLYAIVTDNDPAWYSDPEHSREMMVVRKGAAIPTAAAVLVVELPVDTTAARTRRETKREREVVLVQKSHLAPVMGRFAKKIRLIAGENLGAAGMQNMRELIANDDGNAKGELIRPDVKELRHKDADTVAKIAATTADLTKVTAQLRDANSTSTSATSASSSDTLSEQIQSLMACRHKLAQTLSPQEEPEVCMVCLDELHPSGNNCHGFHLICFVQLAALERRKRRLTVCPKRCDEARCPFFDPSRVPPEKMAIVEWTSEVTFDNLSL